MLQLQVDEEGHERLGLEEFRTNLDRIFKLEALWLKDVAVD